MPRRFRRPLIPLLILASLYCLAASFELFLLLGQEELFLAAKSLQPALDYRDYQQLQLLRYWGGLIPVIGLSGFAYWGWPRLGLQRVGTVVWGLILTYSLITQALELRTDTIFYWIRLISLTGLILVILNARRLSQSAAE